MKSFALTAILLSCSVAQATTVSLPNPPASAITGGIQCGVPPVTAVVTGFSNDGQYVLGQVSTHFSCSTGGRGARPRPYSACALIAWEVTNSSNYQVTYYPCTAADATLVFSFGPNTAWTMSGMSQLETP